MVFSRYAKFMFAPDDGANGGGVGVGTNGADGESATNYKALYEKTVASLEKEVAERAKLKKSFDATASEIAELKKANKAKMSEEEKREAELAERELHYKEMENQLNSMRVDTVFAKNGYDEKDYSDLSKKLVEACGDKACDIVENIVAFVKKSNKYAIENAGRAGLKDSSNAMLPKASNTTAEEHTYAKLATENNALSNKSNDIKNYYRKNK